MISLGFDSSSTTAFWVIWTVNTEDDKITIAITPPIIREFCFVSIIYCLPAGFRPKAGSVKRHCPVFP